MVIEVAGRAKWVKIRDFGFGFVDHFVRSFIRIGAKAGYVQNIDRATAAFFPKRRWKFACQDHCPCQFGNGLVVSFCAAVLLRREGIASD